MSSPRCRAVPWNQALRQVGDPVDVVTGAQVFFETDFRLQGDFLPVNFNRHYDSRRNTVDSGMGLGFRLNLAAQRNYATLYLNSNLHLA